MNNPYLIRALSFGPSIVARIVGQIDASRYDTHSDPERFTLREAVAHLAEWDAIDLNRIKQIVSRPGSDIEPFDEVELAEKNDYGSLDVHQQLELFAQRRVATIAFLETVPPEKWGLSAVHAEKGPLTVYDMANLIVAHDTYHIEHLTQYL
jgi:hypothetical protein